MEAQYRQKFNCSLPIKREFWIVLHFPTHHIMCIMAPHQKKFYLAKGILQLTNIVFTTLSVTQKSPNHGKSYGCLTTHDEVEHGLYLPTTVTNITQINYYLSMLCQHLHRKDLPKVAFQTMKAILGILQGNKILDFPTKA